MPVKMSKPAASKTEAPKNQALDTVTLKQIQKLALPLAKTAKALKLAQESLEKTTFQLYADFRKTAREHFEDNPKAVRALAVNVLASVYDVPISAIHITGADQDRWVYPETYIDSKGKTRNHPSAGEDLPDDASDDDKEIAVHPKVKSAARLYQMASRLLKVAIPDDERAKGLVDEALDDDGSCQCTEAQLYQLATGASREIVPKGSQGGARQTKVYDEKTVTGEIEKLFKKAWNGNEIIPGFKGSLTLDELAECGVAAIANLQAELEKVEKAQKKAAKKGEGKAAPEPEDED